MSVGIILIPLLTQSIIYNRDTPVYKRCFSLTLHMGFAL